MGSLLGFHGVELFFSLSATFFVFAVLSFLVHFIFLRHILYNGFNFSLRVIDLFTLFSERNILLLSQHGNSFIDPIPSHSNICS